MKIFFPTIHDYLSRSFSRAFKELGHEIIIPNYKATTLPPMGSHWIWNSEHTPDEVRSKYHNSTPALSVDHVIDLKPDVIFINTFENQFEIINKLVPNLPNAKIIAYSGNDYWDGAYNFNVIKNYIPLDNVGKRMAEKYNVNTIDYLPWIFYDHDSHINNHDLQVSLTTSSNTVGTYICNYRNLFPQAHGVYNTIKEMFSYYKYVSHDDSDLWEYIPTMKNSFCTLHIKPIEGFGYAIVEGMACGKPVLVLEEYSQKKTYNNWLIDGVTGFRFNSREQLGEQFQYLYNNQYELAESCGQYIRSVFDNELYTEKLGIFLENLV